MTNKTEDKGFIEGIQKSEDKKVIEAEEMEQQKNVEQNDDTEKLDKKKSDAKEGMEVKPKKIPIGGIQMPGFFTRSKSKEKCKEEGTSDIENADNTEQKDKAKAETGRLAKIKLPNPFKKSKLVNDDEEGNIKEKKSVLDAIRAPLNTVISKIKKNDQNMENQAGLASMETLDGPNGDKANDEMTSIPLDDNKDVEKQEQSQNKLQQWIQITKTYKLPIGGAVIFLLLLLIILIILAIPEKIVREAPIRDGKYVDAVTQCGKVEGLLEDSAFAFRGIPYARPPIGDLRFRYAQPLDNLKYCWNDTLKTHNATDTCMQIYSNGTVTGSEDCLTLDVVTPYVRYENPLPVIVLIGSETLMGGSPGKMRPSARFARAKDVVFVRPNFRLGALGFLALDILGKDEYPHRSGNYGLSDILLALQWIQLNIVHFGGDPKEVTLFGHQAGATLVTALATTKNAHKYFKRVWATSGGSIYPKKNLSESEFDNKRFLDIVQCSESSCLKKMDPYKLINAVEDTWRKPQPDLPDSEENPSGAHEWMVLDGKILQENPATVWANKELNVSLVLGTTAHSGTSEKLQLRHKEWTDALVKDHIANSYLGGKNLTDEILKMYSPNYKGLTEIVSDIRIVCPLYAISIQMKKVPFYVVTQPRGKLNLTDIDSDVDAILGRYEPKTPEQRRYVSAMQNFFYHYVWDGNIEPADVKSKKVLVVGQDVLPNVTYSNCGYWINKNIVLTYASIE